MKRKKFKAGKLMISTRSKEELSSWICENAGKKNGYICVTNTRTAYLSSQDPTYCKIQNNALAIIPDGMPLVWLGKLAGVSHLERISGPELMESMMADEVSGIKHFLLGDTEGVLGLLVNKYVKAYPKTKIVGTYSPAFKDLEDYDYAAIGKMINESKCDIVWLALGSPKQDVFSSKLIEHTDHKIIINVGAAFRYLLGEYKMPSASVQKLGLTGVFWRFKERPMEFLKKYPRYIFFLMQSAVKIILERGSSRRAYE
ncbi:WecB/TagA/CpsF family glycosyltransferase [Echinicola sp. 20G]|uniref:WecB/TagA/CpsF family glycosyltransferase n=1 Tax=Echinicola sp. 20G TaxID=2781961 RepID=UPI001910BC79|nr:WecB/TagA/CpsF family glycosyltransferase [Echinicola sp. 20G]